MLINMICPRDYVLRTTSGQVISFKANEPTPVPESLYAEAIARNIVPADPHDTDEAAPGMPRTQIVGPLRDALIYQAIHELVTRSNSEDFDGGGQPKATAITDVSGVVLANPERSKYWGNYREIIGTNSELPNHPNVPLIHELQGLQSRKQLTAFAEEQGIKLEKIEGKSNTDIKAILLSHVVNNRQSTVALSTKPAKGKGKDGPAED